MSEPFAPELSPRRLHNLTPGVRARTGNAALIAAGTGLGMALLVWDGERYHASASEGGHLAFAPRDDIEIALLRHLRRRHGRVSTERVVSGELNGTVDYKMGPVPLKLGCWNYEGYVIWGLTHKMLSRLLAICV